MQRVQPDEFRRRIDRQCLEANVVLHEGAVWMRFEFPLPMLPDCFRHQGQQDLPLGLNQPCHAFHHGRNMPGERRRIGVPFRVFAMAILVVTSKILQIKPCHRSVPYPAIKVLDTDRIAVDDPGDFPRRATKQLAIADDVETLVARGKVWLSLAHVCVTSICEPLGIPIGSIRLRSIGIPIGSIRAISLMPCPTAILDLVVSPSSWIL